MEALALVRGGEDAARPARAAPAAALVARARAGDRAAFGALYTRYAPMVHGLLVARVSVAEAQDLVQDVFLSALRSLERLDDEERVGAWLAAIARRKALDLLRGGTRRAEPLRAELERSLEAPAPEDDAGDHEEAERALGAVRELPEAYRETLVLRLVEGMSGPEIAERCGLTHGSVRVNLCRGMKLLRAKLAEAAPPREG